MSLSKTVLECYKNLLIGDRKIYEKADQLTKELIMGWLTDKNSSTVREEITLYIANCTKFDSKHGPDGIHNISKKLVECKPQYAYLKPTGKYNKLTGGNCYNDITYDKIEESKDYDVYFSGFAEDKLVCIVKFPFAHIQKLIQQKLDNKIKSAKIKLKQNKTPPRCSVRFSWKDWINCTELQIIYLNTNKINMYMSKDFSLQLQKKANDRKLPK